MFDKFLGRVSIHPLRRRLQKDPYYRFQSFEEVELAARWGVCIEANTASIDDWLRLPGISIHQARRLTRLTASGLSLTCIEDVAAALSLPVQQIRPWTIVLQFCYYDPNSQLEPVAVDANTATAAQLAAIPAVDLCLGRAIVRCRRTCPYKDLADLQQRLQLSVATTAELLHYLRF